MTVATTPRAAADRGPANAGPPVTLASMALAVLMDRLLAMDDATRSDFAELVTCLNGGRSPEDVENVRSVMLEYLDPPSYRLLYLPDCRPPKDERPGAVKRRIGAAIQTAREAAGLNRGELGKAVDLTRGRIRGYETGRVDLAPDVRDRLAAALGVDPEALDDPRADPGHEPRPEPAAPQTPRDARRDS